MNSEDIKKLAELSRLNLDETNIENYQKDFNGILEYINTLKDVSVDQVNEHNRENMTHVNILREDDNSYVSGEHTETLISAAPEREGDYIKVNKVL